jgi:basic membrane protein A
VTITAQDQWGRRRVRASELVAMDVDVVTMESVIDLLGRHRFLAFDRDHGSGEPTVEVAHEALLSEWARLRGWIEAARADIGRRGTLEAALAEWTEAERDPDYLLSGKRLGEYERWRDGATMRLTTLEREFLDASVAQRDAGAAAESARVARERGLARRARRRWWALVAVVVAVVGVAGVGAAVIVTGDEPPSVALLTVGGDSPINQLLASGFERAGRELDFEPIELTGPFTNVDDEIDAVIEAGTDLVVVGDVLFYGDVTEAAERNPDVTFAHLDDPLSRPGSLSFAEQEGAYLVGAAAALTSETGTIGFVGGFQFATVERFRAGFEAGARAVDPDVEVLASYVELDTTGFARDDVAREVAMDMYERGADVVFHAAGAAGGGVFEAATTASRDLGRQEWAIGADSDEYFERPADQRDHVLTSMIKRFDVAVYELVRDFLDGGLGSERRVLGLADGAIGYSTTGDHLTPDTIATLDRLQGEIVSGARVVPRSPTGPLEPPPGTAVSGAVTVTFDGATCAFDGVADFGPGDVVRVEFVNRSDQDALLAISWEGIPVVGITAPPGGTNVGYASLRPNGTHASTCGAESLGQAPPPGPSFDAAGG